MTRRASALQTSWLDATGRPAVPPAPTSGTRERPFVVSLGNGFELDTPGLGMWPTGEPAVVEADPDVTTRVMERRRLRVEEEMRHKGNGTPAQQKASAKVDKRLCGGGKPRRRT